MLTPWFEAVRVRLGPVRQRTFRPPWIGSPIEDWCVSLGGPQTRRLKVLIGGRWRSKPGRHVQGVERSGWIAKSADNSNIMGLDRDGRKPGSGK